MDFGSTYFGNTVVYQHIPVLDPRVSVNVRVAGGALAFAQMAQANLQSSVFLQNHIVSQFFSGQFDSSAVASVRGGAVGQGSGLLNAFLARFIGCSASQVCHDILNIVPFIPL